MPDNSYVGAAPIGGSNEQSLINNDPRYNKQPTSPTSSFGNPATFTAAANQQASDYDTIMKQYQDLAKTGASNPLTATPVSATGSNVTPQLAPYSQSSDVTSSLSNLSNLTQTGGYSDANIADIRARDISPTRSIYANAQQNVERAKALSGGYSPNFNAVQSKMARDESNQISDVDTAANAGIAQNVAANKIATATPYANTAATANAAQTAADKANADIVNSINTANANRSASISTGNADRSLLADSTNRNNILGAIQGQTNLYGTTPALTSTFGNQVVNAAQLGQNQQDINQRRRQSQYNFAGSLSQ